MENKTLPEEFEQWLSSDEQYEVEMEDGETVDEGIRMTVVNAEDAMYILRKNPNNIAAWQALAVMAYAAQGALVEKKESENE